MGMPNLGSIRSLKELISPKLYSFVSPAVEPPGINKVLVHKV